VGDTVLDPFVGTGTTMLAAIEWSRHSVGYEIDPRYYDLAAKRLVAERGDLYRKFELELL
jgi:site-specific DNA-methyltransferase (adenine-specific)